MTREELETAIAVGAGGLCVDISSMDRFPSFVREVTILKGLFVMVEFNVYGQDEGGPRYEAAYSSLDEIVSDLTAYLGKGISCWENFRASGRYPDPPASWSGSLPREEADKFVAYVSSRQVDLPNERFRQMSSYWETLQAPDVS